MRLLLFILVIFFLGDLLGYFVGQLTHNAAMENQDALNKMFIHVPTYLQFAVVGFIIPIMEEMIFRGLLAKVLFGKYFKMGPWYFQSSLYGWAFSIYASDNCHLWYYVSWSCHNIL